MLVVQVDVLFNRKSTVVYRGKKRKRKRMMKKKKKKKKKKELSKIEGQHSETETKRKSPQFPESLMLFLRSGCPVRVCISLFLYLSFLSKQNLLGTRTPTVDT